MTGRLMFLGLVLAAMPVAVDLPGDADTTRSATLHADLAGGGGQIALIARGCEGQVLHLQHDPLKAIGTDVGVTLPNDLVIGTRAGVIDIEHDERAFGRWDGSPEPSASDSTARVRDVLNRYLNPYVGVETSNIGAGVGVLIASEPFLIRGSPWTHPHFSGHVRMGGEGVMCTVKWMENVPLESEGHFTLAFDAAPAGRRYDGGIFAGLSGPYDGAVFGFRHRIWLTREAAMQLKLAAGSHDQYGIWLTYSGVHPIRR